MGMAIPEHGTGSHLAALQARARREGDEFILSGQHADRVTVVAKTDPDAGHACISLIGVGALAGAEAAFDHTLE